MKICFSGLYCYSLFNSNTNYVFGGSEVRAVSIAKALARMGHDVSFVVFNHGQPTSVFSNVRVLPHSGYRTIPTRHEIISDKFWNFRRHVGILSNPLSPNWAKAFLLWAPYLALLKFKRWLAPSTSPMRIYDYEIPSDRLSIYERIDADVYCVFGASEFSAELVEWARSVGKPCVLFSGSDQDFASEYVESNKFKNNYGSRNDLCGYSIRQATSLVVQTNTQAQLAKSLFDRDSFIMKNPIQLTQPQISANRNTVLWIGKSDRVKCPDLVVELARRLPNRTFVMIMNLSIQSIFEEVVANSPSNVKIIKSVPFNQIDNYFAAARVLINTSVFEGFPNTFLQAGNHCIPILSLNVDPDGFLKSSGGGENFDGNIEKMASAIDESFENSVKYMDSCKKIRDYVEKNHSSDELIMSLNNHFQNLILKDNLFIKGRISPQDCVLSSSKPSIGVE